MTTNLLKQLFLFLDEMVRFPADFLCSHPLFTPSIHAFYPHLPSQVRFGDEHTRTVALLLRRNVFYEAEVRSRHDAHTPHRAPPPRRSHQHPRRPRR